MAFDIAFKIYDIAKCQEERDRIASEQCKSVKIEFIHGFADGYEVSKVMYIVFDPKKEKLFMRYNKTTCKSSVDSFEVLAQLIFHDFLEIHEKQDAFGSDAYISGISYITLRTHFMDTMTSQCRYVFGHTLTKEDVLRYDIWYEDDRLRSLQCFLLKQYNFARSIVDDSKRARFHLDV